MAAPVNANINVLVNTQQAMAQLRALQGQVATLNSSISATSGAAAAQQAALAKGLKDSANASRMWQARIIPMNTATQQFSQALDKGRMSLGQYTRFAASQLPGMSRVFRREFEMMNRVATQNVRQMQTQYVQLARSATGASQAMALTPTALNKHAAASAIAAQRQMMMNRMIDLGTTKLLNWGKNTQWAGRQLMVGFSIPLAMVGAVAAKAFKEIDKGSIAFKRVYGDLSTTTAEMERNLEAVKALGNEYTRYGIKLADTIELAADVAATGAKNESLMAATEQTLRLATLGLMEYGEALDATIALQTAFQVSNEDLAGTIDFLNVVENETILTMQDMAAAIPRVAPVVKGLGGDVRDLAVFMTAMREGGVTAEQGANALKSGLGRLINPTKAAREVMESFGLSIDQIIQSNRGDLMGMMQEFGAALNSLGDFEQQQVLEKVFGKYQYARLGALFKNLANDASQANRTIELTNMSMEDLASISERELGKIEEATSTKFQAAVERLKVSIAPIGEQFMKALMPVINFITKIANKFNDLPDNIKNAIAIGVAAIAGIGPIVLMTVGLIANGIANIGKLIQTMRKFFARLKGDASLFNYLTQEEREAATAANALSGATDNLTGKFLGQQKALERLIVLTGQYAKALGATAAAAPLGMGVGSVAAMATARGAATARGTTITGPRTGTTVTGPGGLRMATGGLVPGTGNKDTVPAMLTPGESVVTKEATQKYGPMIQAMNAGIKIPGFVNGVLNIGGGAAMQSVSMQTVSIRSTQAMQRQVDRIIAELVEDGVQMDRAIDRVTAAITRYGQTMDAAGKKASAATLKRSMEAEGLTRSSRTLVAAHLTGGISGSDPRVMQALSGHSQALRDWVRANPQYVQATSKLTATLPALLNQQLARGGATFGQFRQGWKMGGKDKLLNAAAMTDDTIRGDAEAGKALRKMAGDIGRRAIRIAKTEGSQKVTDDHLTRATQQVTEKYKGMGGSAARAAAALDRAATQIGQIRIQMPKAVVQQGLRPGGDLVQQGRSVVTRAGGIEVARDRGARGASNIPIAGGLATATARQQAEILNKVMAANGPIAAAAYFSTNTPAMVSGTTAMAQQVAQTQNRVIEANTQDIAKLARDRNSPYKTVGPDAQSDAQKYVNTVKQTLASMTPIKTGKPLVAASTPNLPQGTQFRAPGGGVAQVYNPRNNPLGLGITGEARAARGAIAAIESRTGILNRLRAEEEAQIAASQKFRVVDNRRTGATTKSAVLLEEENSFLTRANQAAQRLAAQRELNLTALRAEEQAQARLNGAKQRAAVMQETMNQRPARGGILDRPLGVIRRLAFPGGQDAALKNLGFNQFTGQVKTAGQLIVESAKSIKIRVAGAISNISTDFKLATQKLLVDAKNAGTLLKSDFKNLGGTIKTNMQVDLNTIKTAATNTATAIRNLGTSAASAAQRMAGGIGGFLNSVDKNGTSRLQKMGQAGNGAVMGLMGLSMAASFAGGSVGEMAQKIMPVTMGLMGLQMILPMFTNPMGLAIIAITALVGTFIWMRKSVDDAAKSAARLAAEQGAAANRMETIAEALDYEFAADRISNRQFRFTLDEETQSAFQNYFEGEAGSKFIADLKAATSEERFAKLSSQLAFAIADGLDPQRARDFGLAVAKELDDSLLASLLQGAFVRGEFKAGSQAMIDLIAERQQAAMGLEISPADYRSQMSLSQRMTQTLIDPVGETVYGLTRPIADLAGTANTTTDVLGRAAIEIGAFTAAGAGIGAAAGAVGGPLAGLTAAGGALGGFFAGLSKVAFTLPKELDRLEENSRSVAAAFSASIQVLRELDNAEALLLEERRQGLITAEEYARKEAELNRIKNTQAEILGKAITELVEQGANEQAIVDQLVMGGFDEATAGAVARATNRDIVSAQLFKEDYEGLTEQQRNFVNTAIADIFSGLTPENAQQKINDIQSVYSQIAADLDEATLGTIDLAALQSLGESEKIAQAAQTVFSDMLGMDLIPTFGEDVAKNFKDLQPVLQDLGMSSTELFNELIKFKDPQLARDIALNREELERFANNLSALGDFESIDIELVTSGKIDAKQLSDALERMNTLKVDDKVAGILLNPEVYANIGMELGKTVPEIENSYTKLADKLDDAFITAKKNTKDLNGEIKGIEDQLLLTEGGEFVINQKLVMDIFGADVENASEISSILNGAFPDGLDPIMLQIAIQAVMDPVTRALIAANPDAFKAAMAGESTYTVSNLGVEERRFGVPEREITRNVADADPFFAALAANASLAQEFARGQQTFDKLKKDLDKGGGGGSKEKSALEELEESILERTKLYLGLTQKGKKLDDSKKGYLKQLAKETTTNTSIANQLRKQGVSESLLADILAKGADNAQEIMQQLGPEGLKRSSIANILGMAGEFVEARRAEVTRAGYRETARTRLQGAGGFTEEEIENILEDEEATEILAMLPQKYARVWKQLINLLRQTADATAEVKTETELAEEAVEHVLESIQHQIDVIERDLTQAFLDTYGILPAEMELEIRQRQRIIEEIEKQIEALNKLNEADDVRIEELSRQKEMISRQIEQLQRLNEMDERQVDLLKRQDEIRNRTSEALNKDLEELSRAEEEIRNSYQKRIEALDKVSKINDHIVNQQKQQLDLSRAISEGDIYAATAAAQEMRASSAAFATEQTRAGLEQGMENQIAGLRTAGGLTRQQAEQQIANIRQQSYQTSLLIRDIEDRIYQRNLQMVPLKDQQYQLDLQIRDIQDIVYERNQQIKTIQEEQIVPLTTQNTIQQDILDKLEAEVDDQTGPLKARYDWYKQQEDLNESVRLQVKNIETWTGRGRDRAGELAANWGSVAANAWEASRAIAAATGAQASRGAYAGGLIKKYAMGGMVNPLRYTSSEPPPAQMSMGGKVFGAGARDSVAAMLTPGEFVIRKAMVDKYGIPMMEALNQGSFAMPRYETGRVGGEVEINKNNVSNINAPVYNTYDMKFAISGSNASPEDIANRVMFKMKQVQNQGIRGNRGY